MLQDKLRSCTRSQQFGDLLQIMHELLALALACSAVWGAKNRSGMCSGHHIWRKVTLDGRAAIPGDAEIFSEKRLRGTCSEANEDCGADNFEFRIEPRAARFDLRMTRLFVDAALSSFRSGPFEMLDNIGDVDVGAIDARLDECFVEKSSCRPNEWMAGLVLTITGLLADEHHLGSRGAFAENSLGCIPPEVAGFAGAGGPAQALERWRRRHKISGGPRVLAR